MLVMDIGNSRIKWRKNDQQSGSMHTEVYQAERISELLAEWFDTIELRSPVIVCSVAAADVNDGVRCYFNERKISINFAQVSRKKAGVSNGYVNAAQLGVDRWVAMVAAYNKYQSAVCVIDAGTALTIDVVNKQGVHLGGLIMPGLSLMRKSLVSGTVGVGEVSDSIKLLADNTADAVSAGCVQMLVSCIGPIIDGVEKHYGLKVVTVITGGDAEILARRTHCGMKLEKSLILDGLEQLFVNASELIDR